MRATLQLSFDIPQVQSPARKVTELNATSNMIGCIIAVPGKRASISAAKDSAAVHAAVMVDDLARAKTEWFSERAGRAAITFFHGSVLGNHNVRLSAVRFFVIRE